MRSSSKIPSVLGLAIQKIYKPAGMQVTNTPYVEGGKAGAQYQACRLELDNHSIVFREAKSTPIKIGHFVTILKRVNSKNAPLDIKDQIDFVVVSVSNGTQSGQFVFDQKILSKKGILSGNGNKGKMAIRVYAPWTKPTAKDAINTKAWQSEYFFSIDHTTGFADVNKVRKLFHLVPKQSLHIPPPPPASTTSHPPLGKNEKNPQEEIKKSELPISTKAPISTQLKKRRHILIEDDEKKEHDSSSSNILGSFPNDDSNKNSLYPIHKLSSAPNVWEERRKKLKMGNKAQETVKTNLELTKGLS